MNIGAILSVTVILFSVIDMIGNIPIIINMKKEGLQINAKTTTIVSAIIMISFLFFGSAILRLFGIEISSFALAGSLVMFFIGLEMILGIRFFKEDDLENGSGSIVPIAFPLLAGAGTLTTIISLKVQYDSPSIIGGILINVLIIYIVLMSTDWMAKKLSTQVSNTLRKVFGILLLAIAIQIVRNNI
ncbi:MAG: MarC family protein [Saprospiraceae bacterium]|nr:MarC family protein [Bacteroidia bacterium]NNE14667.1 MarC family protein [Saprospiraceae bacterium]NNL91542.1 MarC family protein [Saprospiraceae bacterium]